MHDSKLGEVADAPEGHATIQRDIDSLNRWINKTVMKLNKDECRVLPLGRNNPVHQDMLGPLSWKTSLQ